MIVANEHSVLIQGTADNIFAEFGCVCASVFEVMRKDAPDMPEKDQVNLMRHLMAVGVASAKAELKKKESEGK